MTIGSYPMMNPPSHDAHIQHPLPLEELLQGGLELLAELDLSKLLQKIVRLVATMLETDIGGLYLCQPGRERLQIAATIRAGRANETIELARGEGLAGKVWERGEVIMVEDYANWDGRAPHLVPFVQHRALAGFPIQRTGEMLGVLLVAAPPGQSFTFTQVQLLKVLAAQAAVAIQNARLHKQIQGYTAVLEQEIAQRAQVEETLREHDRHYQALFNQTNDAIFIIGPDLTIGTEEMIHYAVNQQAADLLGYTVEELIGMPIRQIVLPETWQETQTVANRLLTHRSVPVYERVMVRKDGTHIWVEINPLQVLDDTGKPKHVLSTVRDITERKQAEVALRQANEALQQSLTENARLLAEQQAAKELAESLQEVALIINSGLEMRPLLIRILQQLRRVIPYDSAGIFLREGDDLVHYGSFVFGEPEEGNFTHQPYDDPTYYPLYTRRPYVIPDTHQVPNWHLNWDWQNVQHIRSWMAVPLLKEDDVIGVITTDSFTQGAYHEKSAQIAQSFANQAVVAIRNARLYKEAQQAREAAESANRAKSQFLATLSHELRTPLSGVLGYTQLLKKDKSLTEQQQRQVTIVEQSGHHLLTLINDLLDLAKIEAGRFELSVAPFEVGPFLRTIGDMVRVRAEEKGLTFELQGEGLPTAVVGDEKRLRQVLINLLGNAVKFTPHGQITLRVERLESSFVASNPVWLQFTVEDTGIGIEPAHLHRIFEPFYQLGGPQQRAEGTGLGLAISQSLIERMGGELEVSSVVGMGSKFTFTLPLSLVHRGVGDTAVTQIPLAEPDHPAAISPDAVPPQAELTRLYAQTLQGDIAAIRHTASSLAQTNPQYQPFLQEIEHLAGAFQVNELQKYLTAVLQPEQK